MKKIFHDVWTIIYALADAYKLTNNFVHRNLVVLVINEQMIKLILLNDLQPNIIIALFGNDTFMYFKIEGKKDGIKEGNDQ